MKFLYLYVWNIMKNCQILRISYNKLRKTNSIVKDKCQQESAIFCTFECHFSYFFFLSTFYPRFNFCFWCLSNFPFLPLYRELILNDMPLMARSSFHLFFQWRFGVLTFAFTQKLLYIRRIVNFTGCVMSPISFAMPCWPPSAPYRNGT